MMREVFGDVAGVKFCTAVNALAVALNDDGQLHCGSGSESESPASEAES